MLRYFNIIFGFLAIVILSCATPGRPTGGQRDETPPVPVRFSPENLSTNFNARTIVVRFDENIKLNKLNDQLIISPPMARPQISSNNRTLSIQLQDTLRQNSTYVFSFGDAIVDMNEGNILSNFQYIFSTGDAIDSLSVVGEVIDAFTLQPMKDIISIVLMDDLDSLGSRSARPVYVAKSNKEGFFQFDFLRDGCFYLAAINDKNRDWTYDSIQEEVAFLYACISPIHIDKSACTGCCSIDDSSRVHDSTSYIVEEVHRLLMFKQELPQGVTKSEFISNIVASIELRNPTENATFRVLQPDTIPLDIRTVWNKNKQKADVFLSKTGIRNLWLYVEDGDFSDTLKLLNTKFQDTLVPFKVALPFGQELPFFDTLKLAFSSPIQTIDTVWLFVENDSIPTPLTLFSFNSSRTEITFDTLLEQKTNYRLMITDSSIFDFFDQTNSDTLRFRFRTNSPESYAKLEVTILNKPEEQCILQVLNERMELAEQRITTSDKVEFPTLKPGKYRLRLIVDKNQDGRWTSGNLRERRQPEPVFILEKTLSLDANWEYQEEWEL
jgi:hypothetical protein